MRTSNAILAAAGNMRVAGGARLLCALLAVASLSGCVTARLHTQAELNDVSRVCGLALGELFQDESEKRLLFLFKVEPTVEERRCVHAWARKNKLRAVFVDAVNEPAIEGGEPNGS